jgi:hypothetical protein
MRRTLQTLAAVLVLLAGGLWLAAGGHRGWTQTSVPVKTVDEVTGLEGIAYQPRFVPGVDFLGAAMLGAGALAGASLLFRNKSKTHKPIPN